MSPDAWVVKSKAEKVGSEYHDFIAGWDDAVEPAFSVHAELWEKLQPSVYNRITDYDQRGNTETLAEIWHVVSEDWAAAAEEMPELEAAKTREVVGALRELLDADPGLVTLSGL